LKILLYTDLDIRPDQLFWYRALGLLTKASRDLGHEAYLVVHPATEPHPTKTIPNESEHSREQPFEAPQPRVNVSRERAARAEVVLPHPTPDSFSHSEIRNLPSLPFSGFFNRTSAIHFGGNPTNPISSSSDFGPAQNSTPSASPPSPQKSVSSSDVTSMAFVFPPMAIGNAGKTLSRPTKMPSPTGPLLSTPRNRETKD